MIKIYKVYNIENIMGNALLRQSILNWYMSDMEWGDKADDTNYDLSMPIGSGRTAVARRIIAPNRDHELDNCVIKLFYPTKEQRLYEFLDEDNYKLKKLNDRKEFEELLNGFIDSLETSWRVKKEYEDKGGHVLLTSKLAMTSKGVGLISDTTKWDKTLKAHINEDVKTGQGIEKKEDLVYVLSLVERILSNDIAVYHDGYKAVHLDIKAENFLVYEIDVDHKTKTVRSLDLGSVRTLKELIAQKDVTLFESSPQTNSFKFIEKTVQQIKICNENEANLLLKQLDLLAVVKMLLITVFGEEIFGKELELSATHEIVKKISNCLHGNVVKASFATWHIAWIFQKLLLTVNRIESCIANDTHATINNPDALSDLSIECQSNHLLNDNNMLTLSNLREYINLIIEILTKEKSYAFNHANYGDFDHLLISENITTMSALLRLSKEKFGKYAVPPISIIEYLSY